ncbi:hypothetical protein AC1031_017546 [Aphanomyces cochlioides]|nr:hypothetical protein AC1031_017546 [Aphanomyces cochlioides]
MMNHQRLTRSMRKTRSFFHFLAASSSKQRKVSRQPKSPFKKPRSPKKITTLTRPAKPSTPVKASRNPSATLSFASPMPSAPALQPAVTISPSTKVPSALTLTEKVSSRDILSQSKLPQVTTATTDDGLLLKKTFKTQVPLTGAGTFGVLTVDVEVVQDYTSGTNYCLTKWYGKSDVGHYELDGPCSLTESHDVFTDMNPLNEKFNTFWSASKRVAAMPEEGTRRFVRGYYMGKEEGKTIVFPTQVTSQRL